MARTAFPAELRFADGAPRFCASLDAARGAERPLRTDEGLVTRAIFLLPADGLLDRPGGERWAARADLTEKTGLSCLAPYHSGGGRMTKYFAAALAIAFLAASLRIKLEPANGRIIHREAVDAEPFHLTFFFHLTVFQRTTRSGRIETRRELTFRYKGGHASRVRDWCQGMSLKSVCFRLEKKRCYS